MLGSRCALPHLTLTTQELTHLCMRKLDLVSLPPNPWIFPQLPDAPTQKHM